jgi:hypothetical protein
MLWNKLGPVQVKPVAWVRNRAGDDRHWSKDDSIRATPVPKAALPAKNNPALIEFQQEQAKIAERERIPKMAALPDHATTSGVYGAHTNYTGASTSVNAIGAEQIREQQAKLWPSIALTQQRLGFGVSNAAEGSPLREIERQQDRSRMRSVAQVSYTNPVAEHIPVVVPESLNRTSSSFPLSPVNKYSSAMVPSSFRAPKEVKAQREAEAARAASAEGAASASSQDATQKLPAAKLTATQQQLAACGSSISTAHSLGYGKRHTFARHYLTSTPFD